MLQRGTAVEVSDDLGLRRAADAMPPSPWLKRLAGVAIFAVSFALAASVVANKSGVDHVLAAVGPFRIPLAVAIFAIVASGPFSVNDALAVSNGVLFGPWVGSAV